MAESWHTFGHNQVKGLLEKQLTQKAFSHAYLFAGPEEVGKKTVALEFAGKILNTEHPLSHADFLILDSPDEMNIETVREFIKKLAVKPFVGSYTVAVMNNAESLNTESSNALLKTLEEPSPSTIIILISKTQKMLPTIISRCQVFNFNQCAFGQMKEFAHSKGIEASEELVEISDGKPGRLMRLQAHPELREKYVENAKSYTTIRQAGVAERILAVKQFADLETEDLYGIFTEWLASERNRLNKDLTAIKSLKSLSGALSDLKTNKNKQLILQSLFLKI
jgi:DNA polymerase-3 subunit delta'